MTPLRWFYTVFWIFIGGALLWQFYNYNGHLERADVAAASQQKHFYFLNNNTNTTTLAPPPKPDGPDVQQVEFSSSPNTPSQGNFTCHVTLENKGNQKAIGVQVMVSPFRGMATGDADGGRSVVHALSDDDTAAQDNTWVAFPDLAPGETQTRDAVFFNRDGYSPGPNPRPQIIFQAEKPKPANAPVVSPTP